MDVNQLARSKWNNFVQRFYADLIAAEFTEEHLATDWNTVAAYITLAWLYRPLVEEQDYEALAGMLRASDAPNVDAILRVYDAWDDDRRHLFWRYAKFFFNTVLC